MQKTKNWNWEKQKIEIETKYTFYNNIQKLKYVRKIYWVGQDLCVNHRKLHQEKLHKTYINEKIYYVNELKYLISLKCKFFTDCSI